MANEVERPKIAKGMWADKGRGLDFDISGLSDWPKCSLEGCDKPAAVPKYRKRLATHSMGARTKFLVPLKYCSEKCRMKAARSAYRQRLTTDIEFWEKSTNYQKDRYKPKTP